MRARMSIIRSGFQVEHREVLLRDRPIQMMEISPKGTVPVLLLVDGTVIEESLEIMEHVLPWKLSQNDREWVTRNDIEFKYHLDRYKYSSRFDNIDANHHRDCALNILCEIEDVLDIGWLNGVTPGFSDFAILPFIRQYRIADIAWFDSCNEVPKIKSWLNEFLNWDGFKNIMKKYPQWQEGQEGIQFGFEN